MSQDAWNHDGSLTRSWENRTLPTDQRKQAGSGSDSSSCSCEDTGYGSVAGPFGVLRGVHGGIGQQTWRAPMVLDAKGRGIRSDAHACQSSPERCHSVLKLRWSAIAVATSCPCRTVSILFPVRLA